LEKDGVNILPEALDCNTLEELKELKIEELFNENKLHKTTMRHLDHYIAFRFHLDCLKNGYTASECKPTKEVLDLREYSNYDVTERTRVYELLDKIFTKR